MLLPLGLGFKLRRFPVMTVLLCALCTGIYFSHPDRPLENLKQVEKILDEEKLSTARLNLFVDYCVSRGGIGDICRKLADAESDKPSDSKEKHEADDLFESENFADSLHDSLFYITLALDFAKDVKRPDTVMRSLASFPRYSDSLDRAQDRLGAFYNSKGLLASTNVTLRSALASQFYHASWGHLLGNMLFLLLFGAYVEQRVGPVLFLSTYILGGLTGMLLEVFLARDSLFYLVGASANISAIMGLFFVLYFRFKMKFMVWYMTFKTFFAPVALIFPILYIGQEFISGLSGSDDVAHFAHLGGLAVGMYLAFLWDSFNPVPWPFLCKAESREFGHIRNTGTFPEKLAAGLKLLEYNSQNSVVRRYLVTEAFDYCRVPDHCDDKIKTFLKSNLAGTLASIPKQDEIRESASLVGNCPLNLKLSEIWKPPEKSFPLRLGDYFLGEKRLIPALRLYDFFLQLSPRSQKAGDVLKTCDGILDYIAQNPQLKTQFEDYLRSNTISSLAESFQKALAKVSHAGLGADHDPAAA